MAYYTFDENNYNTFDASRLVYEEGKRDIGTYKVCYFNLKYKNDEGNACLIKIKTPVLIAPFGIKKNQYGKTQMTVNIPQGELYNFLTKFQQTIKEHICSNIKQFDKQNNRTKITVEDFDKLSDSFNMIKYHKENSKYDDTIVFDFSSDFDQQNAKFFDNTKTKIENYSFNEDSGESYIANVVPAQTQVRIVFKINSICMYGVAKSRKFTIKKNPMQVLIVEKPANNDVCEFSDDGVGETVGEDGDDNDDEWND